MKKEILREFHKYFIRLYQKKKFTRGLQKHIYTATSAGAPSLKMRNFVADLSMPIHYSTSTVLDESGCIIFMLKISIINKPSSIRCTYTI